MRAAAGALLVAGLAVLAVPAEAAAHGGGGPVAVGARLELDPAVRELDGVRVRVYDSDRAVEVRVAAGRVLLVRGRAAEPMLRVDADGACVNASSRTAVADRLVPRDASGWTRVGSGTTLAWHDGRIVRPADTGDRDRFAIPVEIDGRAATISGSVVAVPRPPLGPWLAGAAALVALVAAVAWRLRRGRAALTVALATVAGIAALVAVAGFAIGAGRGDGVPWFQVTASLAVVVALAGVLAVLRGRSQVVAAGVVGAVTAAVGLSALPVFWNGVVLSALPAGAARLACGLALVGGTAAALLSFLPDFDEEPRRPA
jgi:hypothetical protein